MHTYWAVGPFSEEVLNRVLRKTFQSVFSMMRLVVLVCDTCTLVEHVLIAFRLFPPPGADCFVDTGCKLLVIFYLTQSFFWREFAHVVSMPIARRLMTVTEVDLVDLVDRLIVLKDGIALACNFSKVLKEFNQLFCKYPNCS